LTDGLRHALLFSEVKGGFRRFATGKAFRLLFRLSPRQARKILKQYHSSKRKPMKKNILAFIILFLVATLSCAPTNSSRYREGSNVGQQTNLTVQDEQRLTREALPKMLKDYPAAKNQELQKYISDLGMKIVRANKLEGNPYHYSFTVVDVVDVNAFAMPAGTVFVTAPLIALATSEAELVGVVSHEIGHVTARHTAERMYAMEKAQNKTWLYAAGGAVVGAAAGLGLGVLLCDKGDAGCLAKAAAIGGVIGAGGGLLAQKYTFLVNSREDEMEADRIGFKYAVAAGYDKEEVGKFYEKLLKMEKSGGKSDTGVTKSLSDALSTHPPSGERVKQMNELAAKSPDKRGITNTADFNKAKQIAVAMKKK
jgi:predicted Zn-dependent protease